MIGADHWPVAFENSPIGCALVGLDGRFLDVNPALCRLTGYDRSELSGLCYQEVTHPDDLDADLALVEATLAGAIPGYQMDKRYLRADGRPVWARLSVSLARAADGSPAYLVSQVEDLTDRHLAAESERRARRQYDALVDVMPDAVVGVDPQGVITAFNRAAEQLWGRPAAEVVGRSGTVLVPEHHHPVQRARLVRLATAAVTTAAGGVADGVREPLSAPALHADGHEFPVDVFVAVTDDDGGKAFTAVVRPRGEAGLGAGPTGPEALTP